MKDITRTFSSFRYFNRKEETSGFERLRRLLIALASFRGIGYVQGINFIAASLLWHCDEEFAFFILTRLFAALEVQRNYTENLSGVRLLVGEFFGSYLAARSPEVVRNLAAKEILPEMVFTEWIVTLGFSIAPLDRHIPLLQGLLGSGWTFLFELMRQFVLQIYPLFEHLEFPETMQIIKAAGNPPGGHDRGGPTVDWAALLPN